MEDGPPKIVLADDDGDLRLVYGSALRAEGFEVIEAAGGAEALELVRSLRPALLILDLWMPGLSGFEVLERVRREPSGALLTILMLSCVCDADARLECFAAGADDYLVKGMPLADLRDRVRGSLARASHLLASF